MKSSYIKVGKIKIYRAIINRSDLPKVKKMFAKGWKLTTHKKANRDIRYARFWKKGALPKSKRFKLLHRVILGAAYGTLVCHLDGNGMNCRRNNLLKGNPVINGHSVRRKPTGCSSRYRGVSLHKDIPKGGNRWKAELTVNWQKIPLGFFRSEIAAAKARDLVAKELFGKIAHLNFPSHK